MGKILEIAGKVLEGLWLVGEVALCDKLKRPFGFAFVFFVICGVLFGYSAAHQFFSPVNSWL